MNLSINLGTWNAIFAVPCEVIDKHIKLAGVAQLKVLLFMLRHAGEDLSVTKIAVALSMTELDVKDSMQYWIETNILTNLEEKKIPEQTLPTKANVCDEKNEVIHSELRKQFTRVEKPDTASVAQRVNDSAEISSLMQEAQVILARPISNGDCSTLLMLHDTYGLPVHVILMLMQYAVSIGKRHMNYIKTTAISWAEEEIDTIEKAEKKIRALETSRKAWLTLEKIIGIEHRSPSSKEDEAADRWINTWKIPGDLIKEAYDRCVNSKGKYILSYMDGIIKRWQSCGIKTLAQALEEDKYKKTQHMQKQVSDFTSYNIDEYERDYMYI